MARILILGAKGMLGQEFVRQFHASGDEVIGWERASLDITNETEVMEKIVALKPSAIFNCAAYNNVDKAEDEPEIANAINGEAVGYLARAALASGATLVHFSTDYVFSGKKDDVAKSYAAAYDFATDGYTEEDVPDPISKYGESKLLGEKNVVAVFHGREKLPHWYIVRTSKLFGSPGVGETSKKSFPEMMIGFARAKGKIEAIDGEVGSPTYVKDLVRATLDLIGIAPSPGLRPPSPAGRGIGGEGYPSGIYHITNSGSCTWYEYAKAAVEFAGVQAEVVPVGPERFPRKARRPARVMLLNTKLPPLRSWKEALKEFLTRD